MAYMNSGSKVVTATVVLESTCCMERNEKKAGAELRATTDTRGRNIIFIVPRFKMKVEKKSFYQYAANDVTLK